MSSQLPAQSAGRALQLTSDGPKACALTHHQHEFDTVCCAEVVVVIFHGNTILDQRVLHLVIERAEYSGVEGDRVEVNDCLEVASLGDGEISEKEFSRWDLLKTDCEAVMRFYNAPETATSFWPSKLDFSLLKKFPSTSIPYLGGQGLDGRTGNLASHESDLTLIESGDHSIKVSYDEMVVNYIEVARGDFNRDGYQDLFVRMDWHIDGALGSGNDWIVLTKLSPNAEPMMLWRK